MIVAEITRDHLWEKWNREGHIHDGDINHKGKQFDYQSMWEFNGAGYPVDLDNEEDWTEVAHNNRTKFKLYDDDDELYYSGWLLDDDHCYVQDFVLKWAEVDSGCTTILVYKDAEAGYIQEIG